MMFKNHSRLIAGVALLFLVVVALIVFLKPSFMSKIPGLSSFNESSEDFEDKKSCVGYVSKNGDGIPQPSEPLGFNEVPKPLMTDDEDPTKNNDTPKDCFPKDHLDPKELLPNDATTKWAQTNPSGSSKIGDQNFR